MNEVGIKCMAENGICIPISTDDYELNYDYCKIADEENRTTTLEGYIYKSSCNLIDCPDIKASCEECVAKLIKKHDEKVRENAISECVEEVYRIAKSTTDANKHLVYENIAKKLERLKGGKNDD